ncbi:hypothetical protein [Desulfobacula sp.]|uniref:hypothetical protein n=1 Tax=Desulfobacula sp. TaxID=2593537 RepID=UPI00261968CB|nr:hypothetical protein [Desulfobacula sp.]
MILHDFIYAWDGKSTSGEKPISWWPGSYHVKIVKLATDKKNISYLIPIAVILKNAGARATMNTSLRHYIHTFAQKISKEYDIDIENTLWIELDDTIRVTRLHPDTKLLSATLYSISWRPIRPNELAMIKPYITDM